MRWGGRALGWQACSALAWHLFQTGSKDCVLAAGCALRDRLWAHGRARSYSLTPSDLCLENDPGLLSWSAAPMSACLGLKASSAPSGLLHAPSTHMSFYNNAQQE